MKNKIIVFISVLVLTVVCCGEARSDGKWGRGGGKPKATKAKRLSSKEMRDLLLKQQEEIAKLSDALNKQGLQSPSAGSIIQVYEKAKISTVVIQCFGKMTETKYMDKDGKVRVKKTRGVGQGSGVIVGSDGWIITNCHVVNGAERIDVQTVDGKIYVAGIVGQYLYSDIALLKIDAEGLQVAEFADSDELVVGQPVVALGNPFGISASDSQPALTLGVISGLHRIVRNGSERLYGDSIQTDAALNPGNSGGALLDLRGRLIGINGMIRSASRSNAGVGFAIPVNFIKTILENLKKGEKMSWGRTGFIFKNAERDRVRKLGYSVVEIDHVLDDSPASAMAKKHGIRSGDVLLELDGQKIESWSQFINMMYYRPAGTKVKFKIKHEKGVADLDIITLERIVSKFQEDTGKALQLLIEKKFKDAYKLYTRLIKEKPEFSSNLYNMACLCALMNKKREAVDYLRRSMENGFVDLDHIRKDKDLDNIRNDKEYIALIAKYEAKARTKVAKPDVQKNTKEDTGRELYDKALQAYKKAEKALEEARKALEEAKKTAPSDAEKVRDNK